VFAGQKLKHIYLKEVEKQLKKVDNLDRENLLQYNTKKQNNRVPLVITYSKALPNIHEILQKKYENLI
jgi:hypothetical protein